ncbi:CBS domain-containing protein [Brevundimonas sp. SORGH_AS_0993]|uniref:CBS domain-containing protein n=1 Tax=Brevundimonas sp. SORGH_AS_0993 TaxID=3041794 RepID=UPI00277FA131|nr:CBS domain-containing protein [Brevundimonas sp. SORGH_AS_0993]MDQ1155305.1 CBS domain-containing protein [Brevundimonas sp. SORGH_AS_0993]
MFVAEILKTKGNAVFTVTPDLSVAGACRELEQRRVGALVVCDGDRVAGVFSERDVVRALASEGPAALGRPVSAYMTEKVIVAEPREPMAALMTRMTDRRIRHLPVMESGRLVGVVSIGDVVKAQIAEHAQEAESLRTYIAG